MHKMLSLLDQDFLSTRGQQLSTFGKFRICPIRRPIDCQPSYSFPVVAVSASKLHSDNLRAWVGLSRPDSDSEKVLFVDAGVESSFWLRSRTQNNHHLSKISKFYPIIELRFYKLRILLRLESCGL